MRVVTTEIPGVLIIEPEVFADGRGFFYGRYDPPTDGSDMTGTNQAQKIYYHRVGSPQAEDALVFSRPDKPDWFFGVSVTATSLPSASRGCHCALPRPAGCPI